MKIAVAVSFIIVFLCNPPDTGAQSLVYPASIWHMSAGAYAAPLTDVFGAAGNPAVLSEATGFSAGLYSEKRFMSSELMLLNISSSLRFQNNQVSLAMQHFGDIAYNERGLSLGYGKNLGKVNLGISFEYIRFFTSGYRNEVVLRSSLSCLYHIDKNISVAVVVTNPALTAKKTGSSGVRPAAAYHLGIGYLIDGKLYIGAESIKEEGRPLLVIAALRYYFLEKCYARFSWTTAGSQPLLHLGWAGKRFTIEAGFRYHGTLGYSPSACAIYSSRESTTP